MDSIKMASATSINVARTILHRNILGVRFFHGTSPLSRIQAGRVRGTRNLRKGITYEEANPPTQIAHRKAWNSWNTTTLKGELRTAQTAIEDIFIRKFLYGTFNSKIIEPIIIKRQYNIIRIVALVLKRQSKMQNAFFIGYTEEMLGYILQSPVKLELQFISDRSQVNFKYV